MALEILGPYRIGDPIGRGGMGTVYRGVNEETGKSAAVKVLSSVLYNDDTFRERFEAEIETLKTLSHPNIVQLYGYGKEDGHLFYAMELVEGTSLEEELQNGRRFQWREATHIGIEVCRALKHAHDCGVIHRDLKPANLLLNDQDQIKLADFGIAKLFGYTQMTAQGATLGTADYMAPEQADGRPVTPRSDLYSLGSVLYALLSGRPPFRGSSMGEVLHMLHYADPTPIRNLASDVPVALEKIINQLLEKEPQKRIPTALALSNVLQATEHALTLEAKPNIDEPSDNRTRTEASVFPGDRTLINVTALYDSKIPTRAKDAAEKESEEHDTKASRAADASSKRTTTESHFTSVAKQELGRSRDYAVGHDDNLLVWLKVSMVAVVVGMIALVIGYAIRPESPERLFARIEDAAKDNELYRLKQAEDDMQSFVQRHPNDPRVAYVEGLLEMIRQNRDEQQFETRAKNLVDADSLTPVERAYLEAIQFSIPDQKLARLIALVDVYGEIKDPPREARSCLALARRQILALQDAIDTTSEMQLTAIADRLVYADQISGSEPARAVSIWRGIIELYSDKPWAVELVDQARRCLETEVNSLEEISKPDFGPQ